MRIYINPLTVNSIKVLLLCNAINIEPEYKLVALNKGEQRSEAYLAINPEGKVPVLLDDGFALTESNAILQYLANKHQSNLWPLDLINQAKVLSILSWQSNYFISGVSPYAHLKVTMPFWGAQTHNMGIQEITKFHQAVSALETTLKENKFLTGESISIADVSFSAFFIFAARAEMPLEKYPLVQAWLNNISKQKWFIKTKLDLENILNNDK